MIFRARFSKFLENLCCLQKGQLLVLWLKAPSGVISIEWSNSALIYVQRCSHLKKITGTGQQKLVAQEHNLGLKNKKV